jgi:hypothetical protein
MIRRFVASWRGAARACVLFGAVGLAGLACLTWAGCEWGDGGPPNPAPKPGLGLDAGLDEDAGLLPDGGPPKRTVLTRNPWGGPAGNLLVDGDLELSTVHPGNQPQLAWLTFNSSSWAREDLRFETGGLCRSGLRCAVLERTRLLVGLGAAARGTGMVASLWAKGPAGKPCADILNAHLVRFWAGTVSANLQPRTPAPGPDGWCEYQGGVAEQRSQPCLYVESKLALKETALLDAARLEPDTGTVPLQSHVVVAPELAERVRTATELIRRRRIVAAPEPAVPWSRVP